MLAMVVTKHLSLYAIKHLSLYAAFLTRNFRNS